MTNQVKVGAGETAPVETKAYSAMLYDLAIGIEREILGGGHECLK